MLTVFTGKPASLTLQGGLGEALQHVQSINAERAVAWGTFGLPVGLDDEETGPKTEDKSDKAKSGDAPAGSVCSRPCADNPLLTRRDRR